MLAKIQLSKTVSRNRPKTQKFLLLTSFRYPEGLNLTLINNILQRVHNFNCASCWYFNSRFNLHWNTRLKFVATWMHACRHFTRPQCKHKSWIFFDLEVIYAFNWYFNIHKFPLANMWGFIDRIGWFLMDRFCQMIVYIGVSDPAKSKFGLIYKLALHRSLSISALFVK